MEREPLALPIGMLLNQQNLLYLNSLYFSARKDWLQNLAHACPITPILTHRGILCFDDDMQIFNRFH